MAMLRYATFFLSCMVALLAWGDESNDSAQHKISRVRKIVRNFSSIDTMYIEPQHYNWSAMIQNTNTFESYHMRNKNGHEYYFSPDPSYKLGPYFGWRWIFMGYTIDLVHLGASDKKQDFNLSLYSNQIGVDLFYRKSGNDYHIAGINLGKKYDTSAMKNVDFKDLSSSIKGFNLYYIFNHRKFSYPAAYAQSTRQKRSCGSVIAGIGYTKHSLDINWTALQELAATRLSADAMSVMDSSMTFSNIDYSAYNISGGYAYNWVFARNFLFDISVQACLAYKRATNEVKSTNFKNFLDFDFRNLNVDGVVRSAVVWNNNRWYAGCSSVWQFITYHRKEFYTNNIFGSLYFYVGFNFGKR